MREARRFPYAPESVTAARRFATGTLRGLAEETLEKVELMVSELATNCIRHTGSGFELAITRRRDEIRVEAIDTGAGEPQLRSPAPDDPRGRGLQIVQMLSSAWGVEPLDPQGKKVWFTVAGGG